MLELSHFATVFILLLEYTIILNGAVLPFFTWDRTNAMFHGDYCGDGGHAHIYVNSYDRMNFVCPSALLPVSIGLDTIPQDKLNENLWMVSKDEFDNCEVDAKKRASGQSRLLMECDEPKSFKLKYYSFSFKPYSGSPTALVFQANKTYYFIATSSGTFRSLQSLKGGRCVTDRMKVAITVCAGRSCEACPNLCCIKPTEKPTTAVPVSSVTQATKRITEHLSMVRNQTEPPPPPRRPLPPQLPPRRGDGSPHNGNVIPLTDGNTIPTHPSIPTGSPNSVSAGRKSRKLSMDIEKSPWFFFVLGLVCGIIIVMSVTLLIHKFRHRNKRDADSSSSVSQNGSIGNHHYEMPPADKRVVSNLQEPAAYTRLESTGSTGSGGDTPPSYPDSPNGTLDSRGQLMPIMAQSRNGHIKNGRLPIRNGTKDTCVQV